MSALGQKRTSHQVRVMSALPPKADIKRLRVHALASDHASATVQFSIVGGADASSSLPRNINRSRLRLFKE
jgi:hypothetical protein